MSFTGNARNPIQDVRVVSVIDSTEPVTLAEVKNYLRITNSEDDALITSQISAAREIAESYLSRDILPRSRQAFFNRVTEPFTLSWAPIDTSVDITITVEGEPWTEFEVKGFNNPTIVMNYQLEENGDFYVVTTRDVLVSYTTLGINDANIKQGVLACVAFLYYGRDAKMATNYTNFLAPHRKLFV